MKVALELARSIPCDLQKRFFERVTRETFMASGCTVGRDATVALSVALVSLEEIRQLNRTYRRKNRPTDVLSFGNFRRKTDILPDIDGVIALGELVLSPEFIAAAAKEDGVALEQEMAYIFSHGVFHLLGFRHSPRMFRMQDAIAAPYSRRPSKTNML
jgi:probable rRNA maturation factor